MKIELKPEFSTEHDEFPEMIEVDIDENASSIGELISKIHEQTNIPANIELKWEDFIEKISCSYYVIEKGEYDDYLMITDMDEKISNFPKHGQDGAMIIVIDGRTRLVN
ncbi:hypothetical protein [uncultured Chryseobacterium sp.]|uniref:hypothetical protein n=1 Tax=uncultured Chryseobacterium sp. TaxID=259322 RepID=UPI0025FEAECC|nr:hypothetical protein [uncultured Chryseobacterium sp.]